MTATAPAPTAPRPPAPALAPSRRPLLLLDVDGVLNPWKRLTARSHRPLPKRNGRAPFTFTRHQVTAQVLDPGDTEYWKGAVLLSEGHGAALRELAAHVDLVWCTSWAGDANRLFAPRIGLPDLPVIEWPTDAKAWLRGTFHKGSWKTPTVLAWLSEHGRDPDGRPRPWVWLDDEVNRQDRDMVRLHHGHADGDPPLATPIWLLRTGEGIGLTPFDVDAVATWAHQVAAGDPAASRT